MAKRNWNKVTSYFLLKLDPFYNRKINDSVEFIPSERIFFKELFIEPSTSNSSDKIDKEIRDKIIGRTKNLVMCIKGYAGCGKSVYVQKLLYDMYPKINNFKYGTYDLKLLKSNSLHRLEIGAGTSSDDIRSRYIDDLSIYISNCIKSDANILDVFFSLVSDNDEAIKFIDNELIIHDRFVQSDSIKQCSNSSLKEIIDTVRIELKEYDISILLSIDCLWRIAVYAHMSLSTNNKFKESMFYICYDNLDAVDNIDMCREFIKKVCEFRTNLDSCMYEMKKHNKELDIKTFVFLITCRSVTWGRLHLSEYAEDDDTGEIFEHLCDYDISSFYEYVDIVNSRIEYYNALGKNDKKAERILNEMQQIKQLNEMLYVKERFKPLFNYNYRKCIFVITDIIHKANKYVSEAIQIASHDLYSKDDDVYSGSSSIFFRLVFDYFKENNLFEDIALDLIDVETPYHEGEETIMLTSKARIILMYIYNESKKYNGGKTRLDQIFKYFESIYTTDEICDTLLNLFTRNSAWRRPINFSKRPLQAHKEKEDLERQKLLYESANNSPKEFTKFEICKAGMEYIEFIIAHFEFYACRVSKIDYPLPPLFSSESLTYYNNVEKYQFELTCEAVLSAVENCCQRLDVFNNSVMEAKKLDIDLYLKEPIIKKTGHNRPQLHEERVIFCHIYHLESYRNYILNSYLVNRPLRQKKKINKRIVDIIEKYIVLYNKYISSEQRKNIMIVLQNKVDIIKNDDYKDFETKIEYNSRIDTSVGL